MPNDVAAVRRLGILFVLSRCCSYVECDDITPSTSNACSSLIEPRVSQQGERVLLHVRSGVEKLKEPLHEPSSGAEKLTGTMHEALLHVRSGVEKLKEPLHEPSSGAEKLTGTMHEASGIEPASLSLLNHSGVSAVLSNATTVENALQAARADPRGLTPVQKVQQLRHVERWKVMYWAMIFAMTAGMVAVCAKILLSDMESPSGSGMQDSITYHPSDLVSWNTLLQRSMTVFNRRSLWMTAVKWIALAAAVAFVFSTAMGDSAASTHIEKLTEISRFLNAFVGLLLGFFLTASVHRFWSCADGFLALFDAIRNLQMQLSALGVSQDKRDRCARFGVLSAWILQMQLKYAAKHRQTAREAAQSMWIEFDADAMDSTFGEITSSELELIKDIHDPASLLWTWCASLVGRLAQDGDIPGMPTPTYGRVMQHVVDAHSSIRQVRASMSVQAPYIYVHLLASLVHINNLVNAFSFGVAWGTALVEARVIMSDGGQQQWEEASYDAQQLLVSFFYSCFGPFIYQAMLEVGIVIAEPFSSEDAQIPIIRLLQGLEKDLHDGNRMAANTPWQQPSFKQPSKGQSPSK